MRSVADADSVRRQNRGLILATLRRNGPMSRTQLASDTGLSNSSITAIGSELLLQAILIEGDPESSVGVRGRPRVQIGFNRHAAHAVIIELDVNRARCTVVDYAGRMVDRTEFPLPPDYFASLTPADFVIERLQNLTQRNSEELRTLRAVAISVQGMLDRSGDSLKWSPIAHAAGQSIVRPVAEAFGVPVSLHKRGRLLAEGARALYPALSEGPIAAVFIGSTVAMGISGGGRAPGHDAGATEFGHMNHLPNGARCRCGMRGCIEAYAADYGLLRTAYGVPDEVLPATSVPAAAYGELIHLARTGRRNALHAFNMAGRALGFGLSRLMTVAAPRHVVITGPGANSFDLMQAEVDEALKQSLVCQINGPPTITVHHDEREPIFQGLLQHTLEALDSGYAAALTPELRISSAI